MSIGAAVLLALVVGFVGMFAGYLIGQKSEESWWDDHFTASRDQWAESLSEERERRNTQGRAHMHRISVLEDEQAKLKNRLDIITNVANYDPEE